LPIFIAVVVLSLAF